MKGKRKLTTVIITGALAVVGGWAFAAQDKFTVKVPNGLAFSEFKGYETGRLSARVRPTPHT